MALRKFPKTKSFHVDYCGCIAAKYLLNESSIREAVTYIRQTKTKRDFVKTTISTCKDGVRIVYENAEKYSIHVLSAMIAESAIGKSSFHDTVGVVYISPRNGLHYPAFVHVYRCESSRSAQKLCTRFRAYMQLDKNRSDLVQLEQQLLEHNLLNSNHYNGTKPTAQSPNMTTLNPIKTNTGVSSSSTSSYSRPELIDPVKSITEEFKKKIDSQQPLLFPPKDYDPAHAGHGNIKRAQAWKSTEPNIVGVTGADSDRQRRPTYSSYLSSNGGTSANHDFETTDLNDGFIESNGRPRLTTQRSDVTMDPVETVSLAFDFLKDETGSILNENVGNIEPLETDQQDNPPIYRFRPPPINSAPKKIFTRQNNNNIHHNDDDFVPNEQQLTPLVRNGLDTYYNKTHHQYHQLPNGQRTRSETTIEYQSRPSMHLSPRFESRLFNGSGAPISTNPLWAAVTPTLAGSQPNLLSINSPLNGSSPHRHLSPPIERRMPGVPLQHPMYANYSHNRPITTKTLPENLSRRPGPAPPPPPSYQEDLRKQTVQVPYFDTNEFILRASDQQMLKPSQNFNRPLSGASREFRSHLIDANSHENTMLDVYY